MLQMPASELLDDAHIERFSSDRPAETPHHRRAS
jgi:hypothetical protein